MPAEDGEARRGRAARRRPPRPTGRAPSRCEPGRRGRGSRAGPPAARSRSPAERWRGSLGERGVGRRRAAGSAVAVAAANRWVATTIAATTSEDRGKRSNRHRRSPSGAPTPGPPPCAAALLTQPRPENHWQWRRHGLAGPHGRTLPGMSRAQQTPVVPLEAGSSPDNPPCPACGEPLFGWMAARTGLGARSAAARAAGSGVVGEPGSAAEALRVLDRLGADGSRRIANRAGIAAWLGGAGWAGLNRARTTSSRSSRCGGWSPFATRS